MPVFKVTAPDGTTFQLEGPEGATQEDAIAIAQERWQKAQHVPTAEEVVKKDFKSLPLMERLNIGMGKGFVGLARGAAQLTGADRIKTVRDALDMGPERTEARKEADKAISGDAAGRTGEVGAELLATAPFFLGNAAATLKGGAAIGAGLGAVTPTEDPGERLANMAFSGAFGGAAGFVGRQAGKAVEGSERAATQAALRGQDPQREVFEETVRQAGDFVMPPSAIRQPGFLGRRLENIAGRTALADDAAARNVQRLPELIRRELGMAADEVIDPASLNKVREAAWKRGYEPVESIQHVNWNPDFLQKLDRVAAEHGNAGSRVASLVNNDVVKLVDELKGANQMSGPEVVKILRDLRFKGQSNLNQIKPSPRDIEVGRAQLAAAEAIEDLVTENLKSAGKADVIPALKEARQMIAKSFDVDRALNEGSGEISAKTFAKLFEEGGRTGEIARIGRVARAFPEYFRTGTARKVGASATEPLLMGLSGGAGYALSGGDVSTAATAAALPLGRNAARRLLLSRRMQERSRAPLPNPTISPTTASPEIERIARLLVYSANPGD